MYDLEARVVEGVTFDIILGRDFLSKHKAQIDLNTNTVVFEEAYSLPFPNPPNTNDLDQMTPNVCSVHVARQLFYNQILNY